MDGYIHIQEPDIKYFTNYCLLGGARIRRMDLNLHDQNWPGSCNPSIFRDKSDFKIVIRNVNYAMHGSQHPSRCYSSWGPVLYSIPQEDGRNLKTRNFICSVKDPMRDQLEFKMINTKPYTPKWEFQGEEDARIIRWNNLLYTTGVRRDDNEDGHGRMELMQISESSYRETSKLRIKGPNNDQTYCEKNWMPIIDKPYHYVQLTNPTIIIKTDPQTGDITEVVHKERIGDLPDKQYDLFRGSSQVIPWRDYHIAIVHTCELWLTASNRKYARYCHCFIVWDKDWNIVKTSPLFSFANYNVEFSCGLAYHDNKFYIPFALQDNFSFLMEVPEDVIWNFIDGKEIKLADNICRYTEEDRQFEYIFTPIPDQNTLFDIGKQYFDEGNFAAAYCLFTRSADLFEYTYNERLYAARSIADLGHRDRHEIAMWIHCIRHDPSRPEAYMAAAMYYYYRELYSEAMYFAEQSLRCLDSYKYGELQLYSRDDIEFLYHKCEFETSRYPGAIPFFDNLNIEHEQNRRVL